MKKKSIAICGSPEKLKRHIAKETMTSPEPSMASCVSKSRRASRKVSPTEPAKNRNPVAAMVLRETMNSRWGTPKSTPVRRKEAALMTGPSGAWFTSGRGTGDAPAQKHLVHGQRACIEGRVTLTGCKLPPDLCLIHGVGIVETVEFQDQPEHPGAQENEHDKETAQPDRRGALFEVVDEPLEAGFEGHVGQADARSDVRAACGAGSGG